jgi:endonuclease/exonuclease/phosphatase family metal-dependent hydrolase
VRLRVAGYNIQSFRAGLSAAAGALSEAEGEEPVDLVLLQECGPRRTTLKFADLLGMDAVSTHRPFNRVRNAVLFRAPWHLAGAPRVANLSRQGRMLRRGYIAVQLKAGAVRLTAVSVHLGLGAAERIRHAAELTDVLAGMRAPVVVGADLNEGPEGPAARWMADRLFDSFRAAGEAPGETFPARSPTARIDYLFVSEEMSVRRAWTGQSAEASDHRPVFTELELPES